MPLKQIPLTTLFNYPEKNHPRFSHDGAHYTFIAPDGAVPPTLWRADSPDAPAERLLPDHPMPLVEYSWAHTNNHIFFRQDTDGNENWELFVLDVATKKVSPVISRAQVRVQSYHLSPLDTQNAIVIMNSRDHSLYDAYKYHIPSGHLSIVARNDGTVKSWHVDNNLKIRAKVSYNGNGSYYLYVRATPRSRWYLAHTWLPDDTFTSGPLFFSQDNRYLYITDASQSDTSQLLRLDTQTGRFSLCAHDTQYDIDSSSTLSDLITQTTPPPSALRDADGNLAAVSYYRERLTWRFFPHITIPEKLKEILLNQTYDHWIESQTPDTLIIGRCSDTHSATFHAYSLATNTLSDLCQENHDLKRRVLAQTQSVSFTARDGKAIHCYLTMPPNTAQAPLIIIAHGGPWTRSIWHFNPEVHFLTSRGYGCLHVNFRGSTGYGKAFVNAGNKEWGGRMVDDLADSAQWAIEHGLTLPGQLAVMGRSFGGYAALTSAYRYPKLFSCILAAVPPTNLLHIFNDLPPYWRPFLSNFLTRIGDPRKDSARLRRFSPALNADKITAPLFLSYNNNDVRVARAHVDLLLHNMREHGHTPTTLFFDQEGHRLRRQENIIRYYEEIEQFLKHHLPTSTHS